MKHSHDFAQFVALLLERLEAGERTYGDTSFDGPLAKTIDEIAQELLDVCGWSFVLFVKLERLREALRTMTVDPRPRVPRTP